MGITDDLAAACGYGGDESGVDELIAYKDAIEDAADSLEQGATEALRQLQKIDQAARLEPIVRDWLTAAQTALGEALGLECSGTVEDDGSPLAHYDHSSGTCPIHEWLDESDASEADVALEDRLARDTAKPLGYLVLDLDDEKGPCIDWSDEIHVELQDAQADAKAALTACDRSAVVELRMVGEPLTKDGDA